MTVGFINDKKKNIEAPLIENSFTNAICYGQTGSGKTTGFILPNIENRIKLNHGILIYDFKGNIHTHVKILADTYNKLDKVHEIGKPWGKNIDLLKYSSTHSLENMFHSLSERNKGDDYWANSAKNLFENLYTLLKTMCLLTEEIFSYDKECIAHDYKLTKERYTPTLKNISTICRSAKSLVSFFSDTKTRIDFFEEVIAYVISEYCTYGNKKKMNKLLVYNKDFQEAYEALGEYHAIATERSNSGNNGVLQVLNNTITSTATKEFLSKDEFDIVEALNRGEIIIINVQNMNNQMVALLNSSIHEQLVIRASLEITTPITIVIDECHRVICKNSLPDVDICRESKFEYIMATQDISLLANFIGESVTYMLLRNITSQYSFKTTIETADSNSDKLGKREYVNLLNHKRFLADPLFFTQQELLEIEYKYQKMHAISKVVELRTNQRYIVQFIPIYSKENVALVKFIDTGKIKIVDLEYATDLIDNYEIVATPNYDKTKNTSQANLFTHSISPIRKITNKLENLNVTMEDIIHKIDILSQEVSSIQRSKQ